MEERYQRGVIELNVPASSSLCEEDRKTDEFLNAACKKRVGNEGSERRNFKIPEDSAIPLNGENGQGCSSVANEQKVEQGLRHELSAYIDGKGFTSQSGDKTFDIQIPEFSLEAIITGSSKVTSQDIVDLFNVAMKVRRKEVLCWVLFWDLASLIDDLEDNYIMLGEAIPNTNNKFAELYQVNETLNSIDNDESTVSDSEESEGSCQIDLNKLCQKTLVSFRR
ncbi:17422_t:CDS:2 [Rhizophagus irregularis]|nr:17422_t:CDS:2 [Rhizophagus irregularis]